MTDFERFREEISAKFPSAFYVPNGEMERFMERVGEVEKGDSRPRRFILGGGNGSSKTTTLINILCQLIYGGHGWFAGKKGSAGVFGEWPWLKRCLFMGTHTNLEDGGSVESAMRQWFTPNTYTRERGSQKYYSRYKFPAYGWELNMHTYDQDVEDVAGGNYGLVMTDEPMPERFWAEVVARLRRGGLYISGMTALESAGWIFDKEKEGDKDWYFQYVDIEANCKAHGLRGFLEHEEIARMVKDWPEEEREARKTGKPMRLTGNIYRWGYDNLLDWGPEKVAEDMAGSNPPTIYMVMDPHDVRPYVITWWAVYEDGRKICFMEWPDENCASYRTWQTCEYGFRKYVEVIRGKEKRVQVFRRLIDRHYSRQRRMRATGLTQADLTEGLTSIEQELARASEDISKGRYRLKFTPSRGEFAENHLIVQSWLAAGQVFADKRCLNFDYGMRHYAWERNSGKALETKDRNKSRPADKHKCFPNTLEMLAGHNVRNMGPYWIERKDDAPEALREDVYLELDRKPVGRVYTGYGY